MFKKLVIVLVCALPLSMSAQSFKFGTVNSQEIFNMMPEKAAAEKTLQDVNKKYEDEFMKIQEEFTKKYKEFQAMGDTVPETIKMRRAQEVQDSQNRIESFREMATADIQKQQEKLLAPISQKLQEAIRSVGAENKFTFIFDLAYPGVLYNGAPSEDVTPLVKAKLGLK